MASHNAMSLEAAMDEERRAILEILERQAASKASPPSIRRSGSPMSSTRSPIRSMLDVGPESPPPAPKSASPPPAVKYRSMLDIDAPASAPPLRNQAPVRSLLGPEIVPPPSPGRAPSTRSSVSEATNTSAQTTSPRSTIELPRPHDSPSQRHSSPHRDPLSEYQFSDIITSQIGQSLPLPKRNQQAGRSANSPLSQVAHPAQSPVVSVELPTRHSMSGPAVRRGNQSRSPHGSLRSVRASSPQPQAVVPEKPGSRMFTLDSGYQIDMAKAYKNLSDANLMASEGALADLALQKAQEQRVGEGRLVKAYVGPDGEGLDDSSSSDEGHFGDDDDDGHRGRSSAPRVVHGSETGSRLPKTLLAAAEDERLQQSAKYKVRSLFDDDKDSATERNKFGKRLSVSQERMQPASTVNSANNSENEIERDEIKKAQQMAVKLTDVFSTPEVNRSVRVIYRGDFTRVVSAAVEEHKKLRKYLVATDLSDHSAHAMEWAIGTVLRDGDTLVAVCCLSDEGFQQDGVERGGAGEAGKSAGNRDHGAGTGSAGNSLLNPGTSVQHRASSMSLLSSARGSGSGTASPAPGAGGNSNVNGNSNGGSNAGDSTSNVSTSSTAAGKEQDRLEAERQKIVEDVTAKISRLLRRTKLQVRVIVEVIHCKNPKHLVLEMIDLIKPTLVILGSRGRSAIKGVILGSFSNYLVTKSSVPVMVARKRLRKKARRGPMKQVNNLSNPAGRSLASAKID